MDSILPLLAQNHKVQPSSSNSSPVRSNVAIIMNDSTLVFKINLTDSEAITYLQKKNSDPEFSLNPIYEVSFYGHSPCILSVMFKPNGGDDCWIFVSRLNKKYLGGTRPNRAVADGCGYWKADGVDKKICLSDGKSTHAGNRKTLVFYFGKYGNGVKTEWRLHELTEKKATEPVKTDTMMLDGFAICKLYRVKPRKKISYEPQKQNTSFHNIGLNQSSSSLSCRQYLGEGPPTNLYGGPQKQSSSFHNIGLNQPSSSLSRQYLHEGALALTNLYCGSQKQSSSLETIGPNQPYFSSESRHSRPSIGLCEFGTNRNVQAVPHQPSCSQTSVGISPPAKEKGKQVCSSPEIFGPDADKPWSFNNINEQQINPNDLGLFGAYELDLLVNNCLGDEFMILSEHDVVGVPNQPYFSSESRHSQTSIGLCEFGTNRNVRAVPNQPSCPQTSVGINARVNEKDKQVCSSPEIFGAYADTPWGFNDNEEQINPNYFGLYGDDECLDPFVNDCPRVAIMSFSEHDVGAKRDDVGGHQ